MFLTMQPLGQIDFRSAKEDDFGFLYMLHVDTMKDYVDKTWGWDDAFQESVFRKRYAPAEVQIITLNGRDIGMLSLEERSDDVFLRAIEIHSMYQRQNFGTMIVKQIVTDSIKKTKPVLLHVLKVNPAKELYERLGFSVVEETGTHFIMKTSLPK